MQKRKEHKYRRMRGFERASGLVTTQVRGASESRGFAVSRLLTHWEEVVGPDIAGMCRPVEVSYGRGFGATLTLLTIGANAPMLEMQKDTISARVNACYGYKAIHKVRITQTAATGFAEGRAQFDAAPKVEKSPPETPIEAKQAAENVADSDLRLALERLGANVLSQTKQ
ncbi:MAG: DciA family protein [Paracoccaceae bacterium]